MALGRIPRMTVPPVQPTVEDMTDSDTQPVRRVVILGGGVAGLEVLIALDDLARDRVSVTLVSSSPEFTYRPLAVAEPFSLGHAEHHPLQRVADDFGARLVVDDCEEVIPDRGVIRTARGGEIAYDDLVVAVGARTARPYTRGITFGEPGAHEALGGMLADAEGGYLKHIAFVVPSGSSWPLPLYELALMTAAEVRGMGIDDVQVSLISTEPAPLILFGRAASAAVAALLVDAGIEFIRSSHAAIDGQRVLLSPSGRVLEAGRIVTLPLLLGPALPGLPSDSNGFIPSDEHGRVPGWPDVFVAGDATTFPVKQGGIATQQADAVAEVIAARAGGGTETLAPFTPVLRGLLLTGGEKQFLRRELTGVRADGDTAAHALWWPPSKIAGRYLSPYLLGREENEILSAAPGARHEGTITCGLEGGDLRADIDVLRVPAAGAV
jgi:sulfide:quinone oxidoreductase